MRRALGGDGRLLGEADRQVAVEWRVGRVDEVAGSSDGPRCDSAHLKPATMTMRMIVTAVSARVSACSTDRLPRAGR